MNRFKCGHPKEGNTYGLYACANCHKERQRNRYRTDPEFRQRQINAAKDWISKHPERFRQLQKRSQRRAAEKRGYYPGQGGPDRLAFLLYWQLRQIMRREDPELYATETRSRRERDGVLRPYGARFEK